MSSQRHPNIIATRSVRAGNRVGLTPRIRLCRRFTCRRILLLKAIVSPAIRLHTFRQSDRDDLGLGLATSKGAPVPSTCRLGRHHLDTAALPAGAPRARPVRLHTAPIGRSTRCTPKGNLVSISSIKATSMNCARRSSSSRKWCGSRRQHPCCGWSTFERSATRLIAVGALGRRRQYVLVAHLQQPCPWALIS